MPGVGACIYSVYVYFIMSSGVIITPDSEVLRNTKGVHTHCFGVLCIKEHPTGVVAALLHY